MTSIPLIVPEISGNEWEYVKECLDSGWVSSVGPFVERFEREVAAYTGSQWAVATTSGTAALHIALLAVGIEPDDEVLVPSLTFVAPANAVRYVGAWPVFVDAEPHYWQMDPEKMADFVKRKCRWTGGELRNMATGRRVRAVLPVHILGHPSDMEPIMETARKFGLLVVEDATESLGSKYNGRMTGCLGDIACFSFNGNKIMTTGGGGMIVTDREEWARRAKHLTTQAKDDPVEYIHGEIGYNYRLSNLQAAVGCAQLQRLDEFISLKRKIAGRYGEALENMDGICSMREAHWAFSTYWLYTVLVDEVQYGMDSRALLRRLAQMNIQSRPIWQPLHLSSAHKGAQATDCSVAEELFGKALSLPCSAGLGDEQEIVVHALMHVRQVQNY